MASSFGIPRVRDGVVQFKKDCIVTTGVCEYICMDEDNVQRDLQRLLKLDPRRQSTLIGFKCKDVVNEIGARLWNFPGYGQYAPCLATAVFFVLVTTLDPYLQAAGLHYSYQREHGRNDCTTCAFTHGIYAAIICKLAVSNA